MRVSGFSHTGILNQAYESTDEVFNAHLLYRGEKNTHVWLCYNTGNQWMLTDTKHKDKNNNNGWAHSRQLNCDHPDDAKSWNEYDNKQKKWSARGQVKQVRHTNFDELIALISYVFVHLWLAVYEITLISIFI